MRLQPYVLALTVLAVAAELVLPQGRWLSIGTGLLLAGMVAVDWVTG